MPLSEIARAVGTPTYVYARTALIGRYRALRDALRGLVRLICYSVKACPNLAVLRALAEEGAGFDVVSQGELERALRAGGRPRRIVFSGVGKTQEEMARALRAGILLFNVESEEEIALLGEVGRKMRQRAPVAIRVNPGVAPRTHRHLATGPAHSKFGIPIGAAAAACRRARAHPFLDLRGLDCHIGSQMTDLRPLERALGRVAKLYRALKKEGMPLGVLDAGGGIGVSYGQGRAPRPRDYARVIRKTVRGLGAQVIVEPGRFLIAEVGLLLTRVLYRKVAKGRVFLIVDAGMNDFLRPALYGAAHPLSPVESSCFERGMERASVAGPVCESADLLAREVKLPRLVRGDLIALFDAGAYGMSIASSYNSRPRPAEVMVAGDRFFVCRRRETLDDLVRGERLSA